MRFGIQVPPAYENDMRDHHYWATMIAECLVPDSPRLRSLLSPVFRRNQASILATMKTSSTVYWHHERANFILTPSYLVLFGKHAQAA